VLSIEGVPFCRGFEPNTQNPTPKGAPFYIASASVELLKVLSPLGWKTRYPRNWPHSTVRGLNPKTSLP
jgi:hypothetical protein